MNSGEQVTIWIATLVWAVWEVGFDSLQLVPRVVAPTVLLVLIFLMGRRGGAASGRSGFSRAAPVLAAGVAVVFVGMFAVRGRDVDAQGLVAPMPRGPQASSDGRGR